MNTCDTCKWWKPLDGEPNEPLMMVCFNEHIHCDVSMVGGDANCACDAYPEHHSGRMVTGPKFGCVHHEAK